MSVKVKIDPNWSSKIERQIKAGLQEAVVDVHRRAVQLAPRDTGALAGSGVINPIQAGYEIKFGSSRVPYARIHELGGAAVGRPWIKESRYLTKAKDSVVRGNLSKYFRIK